MEKQSLHSTRPPSAVTRLPYIFKVPPAYVGAFTLQISLFIAFVSIVGWGVYGAVISVVAGVAGSCFLVYRIVMLSRLRITLEESGISMTGTSKPITVVYRDIQKVGYHFKTSAGRFGTYEQRWLELYVDNQAKPVIVSIGKLLNRDVFTLLHVLVQKEPNILLGVNLDYALRNGAFPRKQPWVVFSFKPVELQDTDFVPAQPTTYVDPETIGNKSSLSWPLFVLILQFVIAAVGAYGLIRFDIPLFLVCLASGTLLGLITMAVKRSSRDPW